MTIFTYHREYTEALPYLKAVRDCIQGEPRIKSERTLYLPHPNSVDKTSQQQLARYDAYIKGAEFDGYPADTEKSIIGQMTEGQFEIELPGVIEHLEENCDGDGTSLYALYELCAKNILEAKYHILIAEFSDLQGLDTEQLSIADLKEIDPKAKIKQYTRESLIDWDFRKINGVMQLSLMIMMEEQQVRDDDFSVRCVKSYLVFGLDEDGDYYQQKYIASTEGSSYVPDGERLYPQVGGAPLKFIPAEIVSDEESPSGSVPQGYGYLYPICSLSLARYIVSAQHKEALGMMQPTLFTGGWKEGDMDLFKEINGGREAFAFGLNVSNNVPEGVNIDVVSLGVADEQYYRYYDSNIERMRDLGAKVDRDKQANETAKAASINNSKQVGVMAAIANNIEAAISRVIAYCAMYQGEVGQDAVEQYMDSFTFIAPKKFGESKITVQEVAEIRNNVQAGLIGKQEGIRQLVAGGWGSDADEIMDELEQEGPDPVPVTPAQRELQQDVVVTGQQ